MKIQLIDTGYFHADGGAMFGAIPKTSWQHRYPCNDKNQCVLAMRSALVHSDDGRIILIDTGAGDKHLKQLNCYGFFNLTDLGEELFKRKVSPEQVTDVVLTHLHFDHCGYATRKDESRKILVSSFPNAIHWISREQWENCHRPNHLEKESYFVENIYAVFKANKIRLINEGTELCKDIYLRLYDGHTSGQIVPYIKMPERTVVFAGDVIPLAANVSPEWISAYDNYPVTSYYEKIRMLEDAAVERQAVIYCHDAYTRCSTIRKVNGFYKVDQVISYD
jgi:glyoxylase-like metal-dependent hydrolase (beta-lactamase superfamily II)